MRPLLTLLVALAPCAGAPTPAAAAGLTTAQYAALDQALAAFVPLSADRPPASGFDTARSACRELDSSDPLLGPLRRSCTASVRVSRTSWAFMDCLTRAVCLRTARRLRTETTALIRATRGVNRALAASPITGACRGELRAAKAELRVLSRQPDFFGLVERSIRTGSSTLARRLQREGAALDRSAARLPSPAQERASFRAACAPVPA